MKIPHIKVGLPWNAEGSRRAQICKTSLCAFGILATLAGGLALGHVSVFGKIGVIGGGSMIGGGVLAVTLSCLRVQSQEERDLERVKQTTQRGNPLLDS